MTNLVAKVEAFLLEESLNSLCGASAVYLTIENNILPPIERVRDIVDRAVNSSLLKIQETKRKIKILELSTQVSSGYTSIQGLKALKVLNLERQTSPDFNNKEIMMNIDKLKHILEHPKSETDINLYGSLRKIIENINPPDLTWQDLEANMILSDESNIIKALGQRQKRVFLKPRENMKCTSPKLALTKCDEYLRNFNTIISYNIRNVSHDGNWKESNEKLVEITERILNTLGEVWKTPVFMSSASRSEQSEGTYISEIILPLLKSTLSDINGICLSTAERQSIASKARRNAGVFGERFGKKPDIMGMIKYGDKILELLYVESSRIISINSKKKDDNIKLWRETLDGMSFIEALCRPAGNQFGIVGIQIFGTTIQLNVLMKDLSGIPRYFHLDHAEIPLTPHIIYTKSLISLLLTLRNIIIVNKSLLIHALKQATTLPPRNASPSTTVSTPPYIKY